MTLSHTKDVGLACRYAEIMGDTTTHLTEFEYDLTLLLPVLCHRYAELQLVYTHSLLVWMLHLLHNISSYAILQLG